MFYQINAEMVSIKDFQNFQNIKKTYQPEKLYKVYNKNV